MADYETKQNGEVWVTTYVGQNQPVTLTIPVGVDISDASSISVGYQKPGGSRGTFTNSGSSPTTEFTFVIDADELDEVGIENKSWTIWALVTTSSGTFPGKPIRLPVHAAGA